MSEENLVLWSAMMCLAFVAGVVFIFLPW